MSAVTGSQHTKFTRVVRQSEVRATLGLSPRAYHRVTTSEAWEPIWEAGPYYERVAQLLDQAHSHAVFVGWQIDSRLELSTKRHETFKDLIIRLATTKPNFHVYFLMWDYAYFYIFEREVLQGWVWDNIHERVHFVFDNRHPYGGSHHEKMVIVDGETALVGGIDICDDRWDSPRHYYDDRRRSLHHDSDEHRPYHDMSVEVRGEVAADLLEYIGERWRRVTTIPYPDRPRLALAEGRGRFTVLLSRTKATVGIDRPLLVRETEFLFRELIRAARRQLIIENQYFWSLQMAEELIRVMRERAGTGFRMFLVMPSPHGGSFAFRMMGVVQTRLVDALERVARETATTFVYGCPFVREDLESSEKGIYVHSKLMLVDDRFMAIGSSNLNNRGFRMDTEVTLTLVGDSHDARAHIADISNRIVAHWGHEAYSTFFKKPAALASAHSQPKIYLKKYHPAWDPYFKTLGGWLARRLPVAKVFDPPIPLGYLLKSRLALGNVIRLRRVVPFVIWGGLMLQLGLALALAGLIGLEGEGSELAWALAYALALSVSWVFPVPTALVVFFAGVQLGAERGALVTFSGMVVACLMGYFFSRVFPTVAQRFYRRFSPDRLMHTVGLRRLPVLLHVVVNPSLSFQSKIAYQGIFSIPLRWFLVTALLLSVVGAAAAYAAGSVLGSRGELLPGTGWPVFTVFVLLAFLVTQRRFRQQSSSGLG